MDRCLDAVRIELARMTQLTLGLLEFALAQKDDAERVVHEGRHPVDGARVVADGFVDVFLTVDLRFANLQAFASDSLCLTEIASTLGELDRAVGVGDMWVYALVLRH